MNHSETLAREQIEEQNNTREELALLAQEIHDSINNNHTSEKNIFNPYKNGHNYWIEKNFK